MPVYNGEKYLKDAIKGVLVQTFKDFELIIINDNSTDRSKNIAEEFALGDPRIVVADNTNHPKGLFGALNSALDLCNGELIARTDGDDINRDYRLEKQVKFLDRNPNIDIVGGGYELFGEKIRNNKIFHPRLGIIICWRFLSNTYFCHPTVIFRKKVLNTIKYYPEEVCEDFAFLSKVIHYHIGANIKEILVDYRQHNLNYSKTKKDDIKSSVIKTYKENYEFYTGSMYGYDIFYKFHAEHRLKIRNFIFVAKKSFTIANKMLRNYKMASHSKNAIYLYLTISIDILKSIILDKIYVVMYLGKRL